MNRRQDIPGASELDALEMCGMTRALRRQFPTEAGRAALVGTAFHAAMAAQELPPGLTNDEMRQVDQWAAATRPQIGMVEWIHETPVGLSATGRYVAYHSNEAITCGHVDAYKVVESDSKRTVVVLDWKTGRSPSLDDYRLQLAAYALALADLHGCTHVDMAIFSVREQRLISTPTLAVDGEEMGDLWARVQAAARKPAEANVGPHCGECWQRGVCPHRLLPASSITALEPFTAPAGLTVDNLGKAQATVDAMADIVDRCKEAIKAFVLEHGGAVSLGNGKELAMVECAGKRSADLKALEDAGLEKYIKRGNDYKQLKIRKKQ